MGLRDEYLAFSYDRNFCYGLRNSSNFNSEPDDDTLKTIVEKWSIHTGKLLSREISPLASNMEPLDYTKFELYVLDDSNRVYAREWFANTHILLKSKEPIEETESQEPLLGVTYLEG